jgi:hypothetical protein
MTIWAKYLPTGRVERIDSCAKSEVGYMVREYQMAYGRDWQVWAGLKRDGGQA